MHSRASIRDLDRLSEKTDMGGFKKEMVVFSASSCFKAMAVDKENEPLLKCYVHHFPNRDAIRCEFTVNASPQAVYHRWENQRGILSLSQVESQADRFTITEEENSLKISFCYYL